MWNLRLPLLSVLFCHLSSASFAEPISAKSLHEALQKLPTTKPAASQKAPQAKTSSDFISLTEIPERWNSQLDCGDKWWWEGVRDFLTNRLGDLYDGTSGNGWRWTENDYDQVSHARPTEKELQFYANMYGYEKVPNLSSLIRQRLIETGLSTTEEWSALQKKYGNLTSAQLGTLAILKPLLRRKALNHIVGFRESLSALSRPQDVLLALKNAKDDQARGVVGRIPFLKNILRDDSDVQGGHADVLSKAIPSSLNQSDLLIQDALNNLQEEMRQLDQENKTSLSTLHRQERSLQVQNTLRESLARIMALEEEINELSTGWIRNGNGTSKIHGFAKYVLGNGRFARLKALYLADDSRSSQQFDSKIREMIELTPWVEAIKLFFQRSYNDPSGLRETHLGQIIMRLPQWNELPENNEQIFSIVETKRQELLRELESQLVLAKRATPLLQRKIGWSETLGDYLRENAAVRSTDSFSLEFDERLQSALQDVILNVQIPALQDIGLKYSDPVACLCQTENLAEMIADDLPGMDQYLQLNGYLSHYSHLGILARNFKENARHIGDSVAITLLTIRLETAMLSVLAGKLTSASGTALRIARAQKTGTALINAGQRASRSSMIYIDHIRRFKMTTDSLLFLRAYSELTRHSSQVTQTEQEVFARVLSESAVAVDELDVARRNYYFSLAAAAAFGSVTVRDLKKLIQVKPILDAEGALSVSLARSDRHLSRFLTGLEVQVRGVAPEATLTQRTLRTAVKARIDGTNTTVRAIEKASGALEKVPGVRWISRQAKAVRESTRDFFENNFRLPTKLQRILLNKPSGFQSIEEVVLPPGHAFEGARFKFAQESGRIVDLQLNSGLRLLEEGRWKNGVKLVVDQNKRLTVLDTATGESITFHQMPFDIPMQIDFVPVRGPLKTVSLEMPQVFDDVSHIRLSLDAQKLSMIRRTIQYRNHYSYRSADLPDEAATRWWLSQLNKPLKMIGQQTITSSILLSSSALLTVAGLAFWYQAQFSRILAEFVEILEQWDLNIIPQQSLVELHKRLMWLQVDQNERNVLDRELQVHEHYVMILREVQRWRNFENEVQVTTSLFENIMALVEKLDSSQSNNDLSHELLKSVDVLKERLGSEESDWKQNISEARTSLAGLLSVHHKIQEKVSELNLSESERQELQQLLEQGNTLIESVGKSIQSVDDILIAWNKHRSDLEKEIKVLRDQIFKLSRSTDVGESLLPQIKTSTQKVISQRHQILDMFNQLGNEQMHAWAHRLYIQIENRPFAVREILVRWKKYDPTANVLFDPSNKSVEIRLFGYVGRYSDIEDRQSIEMERGFRENEAPESHFLPVAPRPNP